ncbi:tRNA (guanosine(37)-N1)-methyltransferase TrmD [uncultured Thiothrix sp.]|uniref:tRNA (guanosine(37)-N1)-methyltransferase TrmD n=1 Tax=uncultured Thiothrix sp. TaxID=223185 RepID=UPI00260EFB0F|nr:tRNA (guanosine(37)-N1)-methyltransferase TrmD [uncultured Thiothrix sp.]
MQFVVLTLFPELVQAVTQHGIVRRAIEQQAVKVSCYNPRDYTLDVHRTVDDRPYGGGPGMVMKSDCLLRAIRDVRQQYQGRLVYLSPQGEPLTQAKVQSFAQEPRLILLCGRYEGIDERILQLEVDEECSIGDYVLSGGELGAMVLIDSITRLLPGVLGHEDSAEQDSFAEGLLDCPHYTRPELVEGLEVPAVLKSGNHAAIARWRKKQMLGATWLKRPDLLAKKDLSAAEQALLNEFRQEYKVSSEVIS